MNNNNSVYVNLELPEEIEKMGKLLGELNVENDRGEDVSVVYYESGIPEFDKFLKYEPFFEYGLTFHICSYENAIAFVLYHPKKLIYAHRIAVWRESILDDEHTITSGLLKAFVKQNSLLNAAKSGRLLSDGGIITSLAGGLISLSTGTVLSKLRGVKTINADAFCYEIFFEKSNHINIYCKAEHANQVGQFILTHVIKKLDYENINKLDSRCYIATACYSKLESVEITTFRNWRDNSIAKYNLGRLAIRFYYLLSPLLIKYFSLHTRILIRKFFLNPIFKSIYSKYYGQQRKF